MQLTQRDLIRLRGVNPDLVRVVKRCAEISSINFFVIQGLRTLAEQKKHVALGKSQTMRSRHLTGHAVDLGILKPDKTADWAWDSFVKLNRDMMKAATLEDVPLEWGGAWKTIKDGDHWQLPWLSHPA